MLFSSFLSLVAERIRIEPTEPYPDSSFLILCRFFSFFGLSPAPTTIRATMTTLAPSSSSGFFRGNEKRASPSSSSERTCNGSSICRSLLSSRGGMALSIIEVYVLSPTNLLSKSFLFLLLFGSWLGSECMMLLFVDFFPP